MARPVLGGEVALPRPAACTLVGVAVLGVVALPFAAVALGPQPSFLPMVLSVVLVLDLLSVHILVNRFRDSGDVRILRTAVAYVWSAVVVVGYGLTFPGLLASPPPVDGWPSAGPWLYVLWHVGFPALLGLAWWSRRPSDDVPPERRARRTTRAVVLTVTLATVAVVAVVAVGDLLLPELIEGLDTTRMSKLVGPPGVVVGVVSAVVVGRGTRRRTGPERWTTVTAWVCVVDLVLTFVSLHRYSVGWYVGRSLTVAVASVVFFAFLRELTALQRSLVQERGRFYAQARTDDLTGLTNRLGLREELAARLATGDDGWLVLVDLDRFKVVNDSLGHAAGDEVIVETGRRLRAVSSAGTLVARLGGDEFALLLPAAGGEAVEGLLADGLAALHRPYELAVGASASRAHVGGSLGVTRLGGILEPGEALRRADLALYRAKGAGRGVVATYDDSLEVEARRRLDLETLVREGLEVGGLVAHAQPIVRFPSGQVMGYELLARFRHDGDETLPDGLIDVAEETGLITEIDSRMLHAAAELLLASPGEPLVVAVNISARTLLHPGFADEVRALAGWVRGAAGRIAVEVREQALLQDVEGATAALTTLRAAGLLVGIDDFGTGLTSLPHLRRFPLDFVKLDATLVADLDGGSESSALCEALLDIARALGLDVVAEGVETEGQALLLGRIGCPFGQGFHLGRPGPLPGVEVGGEDGRLPADRARRRRTSARHRPTLRP